MQEKTISQPISLRPNELGLCSECNHYFGKGKYRIVYDYSSQDYFILCDTCLLTNFHNSKWEN